MKLSTLLPVLAASAMMAFAVSPAVAEPGGIINYEGVRLLDTDRMIRLGEAEADVLSYVNSVFGAAPVRSEETCRTGRYQHADWGKGLRLTFRDGKFIGWSADPSLAPGYTNRAGVVFGRPVSAIAAQNEGFMLMDAVRGKEFVLDGVHGRVLQSGPDATIDALWVGPGCYRR